MPALKAGSRGSGHGSMVPTLEAERDRDRLPASNHGPAMDPLDEVNRKLLALLQADDRLPLTKLSAETGIAPSTVNERIKQLVRRGFITGFHARLAPQALGLDLLAFILVGWSDPKTEPNFLKKIRASAAVLECHHITGTWNYLLKIRIKNTGELESFLANTIKGVKGVERTETIIALSSAKETWSLDVSK
jgi:Lrp/AsnC family leucine-responsive transcriptional regulator